MGPSLPYILVAALSAGCGERGEQGGDTPCDVYLECVHAVDSETFEELRDVYGRGGACAAEHGAPACSSMCEEALEVLAMAHPDASACDPDGIDDGDEDGPPSTDPEGSESSGASSDMGADGVDILLVIDNSGSMGAKQAAFVSSVAALVEPLDALGVDYRIGVTTTDQGNYWCKGAGISAPENGNFVFSSCRERLNDFLFSGDNTDNRTACTDRCPAAWGSIRQSRTTLPGDPRPKRRPWIEVESGRSNLPAGLDVRTALQCLVPQGINGCGFESHLESMHTALRRAGDEAEDEFGFRGDGRATAVLFVTDEADCSFNPAWETIFFPDTEGGNQVFWSLPDVQQSPSSAVCWNAGVACSPSNAGTYDHCDPVNKDVNGKLAAGADDAVLFPLSRYLDAANTWQGSDSSGPFIVGAIAGVPVGYPDVPIGYTAGENASNVDSFPAKFGVGEGCTGPRGEAVPPVRLRDFAAAFSTSEQPHLYSACDGSYRRALADFGQRIAERVSPN